MESFEELGNKFATDKVTHHGYHRFYPLFLEKYRRSPMTMLEIGIGTGNSYRFWEAYFPESKIYGIDIREEFEAERGKVFKGAQADKTFLDDVIQNIGSQVDLIIDDGSHKPEDQIETFNYLFSNLLKEGGTYIIEDIETSYWEHGFCYGNLIEKGYKHASSVIEIFKNIIDCVNDEFLKDTTLLPHLAIPLNIQQQIALISFQHNSIIILKKDHTFERFNNREYRFKAMLNKRPV